MRNEGMFNVQVTRKYYLKRKKHSTEGVLFLSTIILFCASLRNLRDNWLPTLVWPLCTVSSLGAGRAQARCSAITSMSVV